MQFLKQSSTGVLAPQVAALSAFLVRECLQASGSVAVMQLNCWLCD